MPPKTIKLTRDPHVGIIREDEQAGAAITPGEFLEFAADGDLQAHSTAGGGPAQKMVALEEEFQETASGTSIIDVDYSTGDNVRYLEPFPGCEVYAWLADGQDVEKGDALESDGSGNLQAQGTGATGDPENTLAYAAENADNTGGASERTRIKVKIA